MPATSATATELSKYLDAYRPDVLSEESWTALSKDVLALVERGGALRVARVANDLSAVVTMAAHLIERGRPLTLEEVLSDQALVTFDAAMQGRGETEGHRSNRRGALRRLARVYAGGPVPAPRQAAGARADNFTPHSMVADLRALLDTANSSNASGAAELVLAVDQVRAERAGQPQVRPVRGWTRAHRFAHAHGFVLNLKTLKNIVTHEVLELNAPAAVLAGSHGLNRQDLELALRQARELPAIPDETTFALLRGGATASK